ncbi:hybrid sensor histidine kinase/response regulator [Labrys monachus]|uniref:histidine kinase n=1 Tax=Labrys monachus TaxID=217067 RepID=A0ABU0FMA0_9HYPH|nr:hybrid sensor histidine kinase/response regulator [Labrys monachus]MDQ0395735.1 two-component system sensor histidine kinase and response regulator WspE [Labrys monachus]
MSGEDFSQFSMLDLFRAELETQSHALTAGLLALERQPMAADHLEACMRAAHSLKGAARIIDLTPAVTVTHAMEECFVAAQRGQVRLQRAHISALFGGVDLLAAIAAQPEGGTDQTAPAIAKFLKALADASAPDPAEEAPEPVEGGPVPVRAPAMQTPQPMEPAFTAAVAGGPDRIVRLTAGSLNRLLGLAGEALIEARRLKPFAGGLVRLKRLQTDLARSFDALRSELPQPGNDERVAPALADAGQKLAAMQEFLAQRLGELDSIDRRVTDLANRLYDETLASRMGPLEDGVKHYSRMVRDLGLALGKIARLEIVGGSTSIDRDILDQLDAPLGHLLRNAVDHGLETPGERIAAGKPEEATVRIEARHSAGRLQIIVSDDGRGVDLDVLRRQIGSRRLASPEAIGSLSEEELLEFLFLPGFSLKTTVSDISGRGVGLDAVRDMARQVGGLVRVSSAAGVGTSFQLELPLTLSVVRTLLAEIDGELYAFPLVGIARALRLPRERVELVEGRPHFRFDGRQIGLITAHDVLERAEWKPAGGEFPVVVIGERERSYGVIVDRFAGERELVVQPLDPRLGKVKDVSAAALMDDGSPVLILDVDDLIRSVEKLASSGRLRALGRAADTADRKRRKRVLVVDDSLTVRELERKLLDHHGYHVEVAVDGMDGWNAVRSDPFDLVVTDVDMPRMDGIELVTLIKNDVRLGGIPVMIVSYKDREEDRRRGLDAGADYYLAKGSFHDETLVRAVADLIGEADE